jgi:uncharacterized damage-inducible protein DinB
MAQRWFDRRFELVLPVAAFGPILGRLRSTPDRIEAAVKGHSRVALTRRAGDSWSAQENVGHLLDLEWLWEKRLDDFDAGATALEPADLENRKTHGANHNARQIEDLLREFKVVRTRIVGRMERMTETQLARVALHPRLQQPMSVVDLAYFVAEHDDHHLATIAQLLAT